MHSIVGKDDDPWRERERKRRDRLPLDIYRPIDDAHDIITLLARAQQVIDGMSSIESVSPRQYRGRKHPSVDDTEQRYQKNNPGLIIWPGTAE
jgi:hypothetical protein